MLNYVAYKMFFPYRAFHTILVYQYLINSLKIFGFDIFIFTKNMDCFVLTDCEESWAKLYRPYIIEFNPASCTWPFINNVALSLRLIHVCDSLIRSSFTTGNACAPV